MPSPWSSALLIILYSLFLLTTPADAQVPPQALSEEARVSLITILPGDDIPSMYGHSALRVRDPVRDVDWAYNYGTYDFSDPFFLPKFMYGHLDYFLDVSPYIYSDRRYRLEGRPIIEQELSLTVEERNELFRLLQENALPENRVYRYDFFFDNCSTRPRDVVAAVLGERLSFPGDVPALTFRELIDPYAADRPFLDLGMDALLGIPSDRVASEWEQMFLPDHLMAAFERAVVEREGAAEPLVARTDTLFWAEGYARPARATNWPLLIGWLLFAGGLLATFWQQRSSREESLLPDALLLFAAGVAGLLIAFLVFISLHAPARYNMNLLWAWPTHLWAAAALLRGRRSLLLRRYLWTAAAVNLLLALGWFFWPQALPAALLPVVLLLALRCAWRAYQLTEAPLATDRSEGVAV